MSCFCCFKRSPSPTPVNNQHNPVVTTPKSYPLNAYNSNHVANDISTSTAPVGSELIIPSKNALKPDPININEHEIDLGDAQNVTETSHLPSPVVQEHESQKLLLEKLSDAISTSDIDTLVRLQDLWSIALNGDGYTAAHFAVSANATKILERMIDTELKLTNSRELFGICDNMGRSPIHLCLSKKMESTAVFEQLLRLDLSVISVNISKSGDSLLTLAMNQPNEEILKLLLQAIPNNSAMLFLISQHKDVDNQTAIEKAFGSIDNTPKHSQLIISLAHILGQLDIPSWTFWLIKEEEISGFRSLLDVDCARVLSSTKIETQTTVLKELVLNDSGGNVLEFLDAVQNAVTSCQISVYEQLVTVLPTIITTGKLELLKALLEFPEVDQVCKLTSLTEDGTLLHHAIALNQSEMVQMLLPISLNTPNGQGYFPIHLAILTGNAIIADLVLTHFQEPDIPGPNGQTAMHIAIQHAHPTIISRLTAHGASASIADSDGLYPLHLAHKAKQPESVHALIVAGARGDSVTHNGLTPLLLTLQSYDSVTSSQLIAQLLNAPGTDLYMCDNMDKNTALHIAVAKGNVSVLRFMYESASPTSPGSSSFPQNQGIGRLRSPWEVLNAAGWTPGHVAVISGHPHDLVCELLSLCDSDVLNTLSSSGQTLLDLIYEQEPPLSDSMIKSIRQFGARRACELSLQVKTLDDQDLFYSIGTTTSNQRVATVSLNQVTGDDAVAAYLVSNLSVTPIKTQHPTDNIETSNSQWSPQMAEDPVAAYLAASDLPLPSTKVMEPSTAVSKTPVFRLDVDSSEMNDLTSHEKKVPTNVSTFELINDQSNQDTKTMNRIEDMQPSDGDIFESAQEIFLGDEIMRKYHEQVLSTTDSYTDESKNKLNPSPSQICPPEMKKIFHHETEMKASEENSNALEEVRNGDQNAVPMTVGDIVLPQNQDPRIEIDIMDAQHGAENAIDSKTARLTAEHANKSSVEIANPSSKDTDNQDCSSIKLPSSTELSIDMNAVEMRDLVEEFGLTELIHLTDSDQSNPKAMETAEDSTCKNKQSKLRIVSEPSTYDQFSKSQMELSEKLKILSKEELELIELTRQSVINRDMHLTTQNENSLNETPNNNSSSQALIIDMNDDITGIGDELLIRLPSSANLSRVNYSVAADHQVPENALLVSRLQKQETDIVIQMKSEFPMQLHHSRNPTCDTEASVDISEIDRSLKAGHGL